MPPRQQAQLHALSGEVGRAVSCCKNVLVVGDFNARSFALGDSVEHAPMATALADMVGTHGLIVHNRLGVVTRHGSDAVGSSGGSFLDVTLSSGSLR